MRRTARVCNWLGGVAAVKSLGKDLREPTGQFVNVQRDVAQGSLPIEARTLAPTMHKFGKWNRELRADIYDELLKLPLRFSLHSFDRLVDHSANSAVGYAPPLGPADPIDTIPFFVHRNAVGHLPGRVHSMHAKINMPNFFMTIRMVEGDLFRFEEELLKIFPTKKIFVKDHTVYVFNVNNDGKVILHHWLLGLGF